MDDEPTTMPLPTNVVGIRSRAALQADASAPPAPPPAAPTHTDFAAEAELNRRKDLRLAAERLRANKQVLRSYRIKS